MAQFTPEDLANMEKPALEPPVQAAAPSAKAPSFTEWLGSPEALAFASGMLKAGGPTPYPVSIGQAVGMGMEDMLKAKLNFGNQNLEKEKFGYQKTQDAKQLDLQNRKFNQEVSQNLFERDLSNKKFGLSEQELELAKKTQGLHAKLYEAQAAEALQKVEKQKQLANLFGQFFPEMAASVPNATPQAGALPPTLGDDTKQPGLLNSAPPAMPQQAPSAGMLNTPPQSSPISPQSNNPQANNPKVLNDLMLKASLLNGDMRSAGQIYKNMNDWDTQQAVDPNGNGSYFQVNKTTGEVRQLPGLQPPGTSATLEFQKTLNQKEAENFADLNKRVTEFTPILDNFNNIRQTLAKGVETGAVFDQISTARNLAKTMGLDIDKDKLEDMQFIKQQIGSAFNKYQAATRIPGVGSQSDREFASLLDQFLTTEMAPETILKVMKSFERNLKTKQRYVDFKGNWISRFGSPLSKDPATGKTFNDFWRLHEKQIYGGNKK